MYHGTSNGPAQDGENLADNAIIRVELFIKHCTLAPLPG
ncbi:MAG: hypothetical protein GPOALKHO_000715 [Sodalis sp.]|nr:MAG: hypothetical protein GPOALKHO_000715 [Sodalis sp.]